MPGTRLAKARRGCIALSAFVVLHIVMLLCICNLTYCSPTRPTRVYLTLPNIVTAVEVVHLWWHTASFACCVNLVVEARVCDEDMTKRVDMDLMAVPMLILSWAFFLLTLPIYMVRWVMMRLVPEGR